jgi:hypothetical protein
VNTSPHAIKPKEKGKRKAAGVTDLFSFYLILAQAAGEKAVETASGCLHAVEPAVQRLAY